MLVLGQEETKSSYTLTNTFFLLDDKAIMSEKAFRESEHPSTPVSATRNSYNRAMPWVGGLVFVCALINVVANIISGSVGYWGTIWMFFTLPMYYSLYYMIP